MNSPFQAQEAPSIPTEDAVLDLIGRLEAAAGGSGDLDARIYNRLGCDLLYSTGAKPYRRWPDGSITQQRKVTTSLDAALALAERVLPGWCWIADGGGKSRATGVVIGNDDGDAPAPAFTGHAATPPLALCIAVLKATAASAVGISRSEMNPLPHPSSPQGEQT